MKSEFAQSLDRMAAARAAATKLQDELKASLAIESLIPGAFADGPVRSRWTSRYPHKNKEDFTVVLIDSSGKETTVIGEDIPEELFDPAKFAALADRLGRGS